jgi:hypothetical protein
VQLLNATRMQAGYTLGLEPDGRERLVVAVKGTFSIPESGGEVRLAEEQAPLVMADEFVGEPGRSAMRYESDFAPFKPRCDVTLNGSAYAPGGRPARRVPVSLRVGRMRKSFDVVGDRVWRRFGKTRPEPFTVMPIHYGRAYGGVDARPDRPERQEWYTANPVGIGHYPLSRGSNLRGKPLPNTEEHRRRVRSRSGRYRPMSFGPLGRNFASRIRFAGTYDRQWEERVFPFPPADFDPRYYQSAPEDQQIPYPQGGELVELLNLTPNGTLRFALPAIEVPVEFTDQHYQETPARAVLDTVVIDSDARRLLLTWRSSLPLKRNLLELREVVVGRMSPGWYRARRIGKTYYRSVATIPRRARRQR